jgi:type IV secretory pathway VirB9-like protein
MNLHKLLFAAALIPLFASPASAGDMDVLKIGLQGDKTDAMPAAKATRLVTFRYSRDVSFAVRALVDTFVNVEVPEGEVVQGFYLSDMDRWEFHVTEDGRRVLVKPLQPGLINTGTMVTDKRSYELTLISVSLGEPWYQRVSWVVPGAKGSGEGFYWRGGNASVAAASKAPDPLSLAPGSLNFKYKVRGKAPFKPTTVFDDGVRTWFRFDGVQDLPAIFAIVDKKVDVVEFSVQGNYVVVPSLAKQFVLRLRSDEIKVERR